MPICLRYASNVQLGISLSPGQQYLIHSYKCSYVFKRKNKGDSQVSNPYVFFHSDCLFLYRDVNSIVPTGDQKGESSAAA